MTPAPPDRPTALRPLPSPAAAPEHRLRVVPWRPEPADDEDVDPRAPYVETFWLPVLGPSATWLLRRLTDRLEDDPAGFSLDPVETATCLGLTAAGPHSSFHRALGRLERFEMVERSRPDTIGVRRAVPPLPDRLLRRLPLTLRTEHRQWDAWRAGAAWSDQRRRARAAGAVEQGHRPRAVERRLLAWGAHPALAYDGARNGRPALVAERPDRDPGG